MMTSDESAREAALDLRHSVIVQAPAGSGKTELLCRRFLTALAQMEQPEEVLAITFTKKAANEMRERILRYLKSPDNIFAQKVLRKNQEKNWQLLQHPERLQIMTIDGLCARIVEESPIHSGIFSYEIATLSSILYQEAAQRMLNEADQKHPWQQALHALLLQNDNRWQKLQHLLMEMLAKREQWLMLLPAFQTHEAWRQQLEDNLKACFEESLQAVQNKFPVHLVEACESLMLFANTNLGASSSQNTWLALPKFLLTQTLQLRKMVDKRVGFPVGENKEEKTFFKMQKEKMIGVLKEISEIPGLIEALQMLAIAPPEKYTEAEWQRVLAILQVLQGLMVYWQEVMQEKRSCDFTEVALRALMVLGQENAPTDLALVFDYRLSHILVDEFQDTSLLQYRLLERLMQGWQAGDGRTLFLVGDPLQSIYRFRQAEVGLFLRVWEQGFANLSLKTIQLTQNFRSQKGLVDFYNESLAKILPQVSAMEEGAVAYVEVNAALPLRENFPAMQFLKDEEILENLQSWRTRFPNASVAFLARSRNHLQNILAQFQCAGVDYVSHELTNLGQQPVVMDLLTWLKALLNLEDRLSWLAMLHSPWLNLSLPALQTLFENNTQIVWQRLEESSDLPAVKKILPLWKEALTHVRRIPLNQCLYRLWQQSGADIYWNSKDAKSAAKQFWRLLQEHQQSGSLIDMIAFERHLSQIAFTSESKVGALEIMTIHKSKGLEFDAVFLPALDRGGQYDEAPLLVFDEVILSSGPKFLLAPWRQRGEEENRIFDFIWDLQKAKAKHEQLRVLYVACTRAKEALYLSITPLEESEKPRQNSFLADLWPILENQTLRENIL